MLPFVFCVRFLSFRSIASHFCFLFRRFCFFFVRFVFVVYSSSSSFCFVLFRPFVLRSVTFRRSLSSSPFASLCFICCLLMFRRPFDLFVPVLVLRLRFCCRFRSVCARCLSRCAPVVALRPAFCCCVFFICIVPFGCSFGIRIRLSAFLLCRCVLCSVCVLSLRLSCCLLRFVLCFCIPSLRFVVLFCPDSVFVCLFCFVACVFVHRGVVVRPRFAFVVICFVFAFRSAFSSFRFCVFCRS